MAKAGVMWHMNIREKREIVSAYCCEVRLLGIRLLGMISLSLGPQFFEDYIENALGEQEQHMALAVNYYPQCPEPDLTYDLPKYTDPNALTILLQDPNVAGLQVLKGSGGGEDQWIAVSPRPNALVINLGDQLQALSNGAYKSVWHRAVVNDAQERMSVASFLCPCNSAVISPAVALVVRDGDAPVYRSYTYDEYYNKFWSRSLDDQEHCLDLFRSTQPGQ
ncbi:flavanone 3-dioxygenase 2 [Zea mays]|uniref:flavanone 3-dioxygenase 2 n=1 Tax=Zea mays TaxID=4577 RepID=UPI0009AA911C|nr:flavanone 3-dioxygenase 2 [Zea mays]|eukprot:XP_020401094.1 flavanone 3-dioxygenase 2 [Zea mays]